jgi:uncharacterized membrane protein YtjA (UPF0391 family)
LLLLVQSQAPVRRAGKVIPTGKVAGKLLTAIIHKARIRNSAAARQASTAFLGILPTGQMADQRLISLKELRMVSVRVEKQTMLRWAAIFLVVAVIAALLGFTGMAGAAAEVATFLFFLFIALFVIIFLLAAFAGRKMF